MASYLLMPRPKDLVKGLLIPVTYGLGLLSVGDVTQESLIRAAVMIMAVELLIYPARYQWNDVRGFAADQRHPSGRDRGRLPGPLSRARARVLASCAVAGAKIAAAGSLIVALPTLHLAGPLVFAIAGIFGVAIVYEVLRSVSTGRSDHTPPPVTPGIALLWITVGAGYVVRGITGLALAVDVTDRPLLTAAAVVTLWAYGIAFVTSRWALEAVAFAAVDRGRVAWTARAHHAREHLLALTRWLPTTAPDVQVRDWAVLRGRTPLQAPWNVAMVVAGTAAAVTGRLLCGPCSAEQGVTAAALGAMLTVVVVITSSAWRLLAVLGGAAVLLASLLTMAAPNAALGALPWTLVLCAHSFFSSRTLRKLSRRGLVATAACACAVPIGRLVVGEKTWRAMAVDANTPIRVEVKRG